MKILLLIFLLFPIFINIIRGKKNVTFKNIFKLDEINIKTIKEPLIRGLIGGIIDIIIYINMSTIFKSHFINKFNLDEKNAELIERVLTAIIVLYSVNTFGTFVYDILNKNKHKKKEVCKNYYIIEILAYTLPIISLVLYRKYNN